MAVPSLPALDISMPLDMNGMPRCRGALGVNFGGQCWWVRTSSGTTCKYCAVELAADSGDGDAPVTPGLAPASTSPKRGGWL